MKTEQLNIRLEADLIAALERVARAEALDRATTVRRLLEMSIRRWEMDQAIQGYQRGDLSLGRAAEESGLTQWELLDAIRVAGVAYPLSAEEARERLDALFGDRPNDLTTLPDIPPSQGGVLLVGINPVPVSVAAGHYYQGRIGRRLWRRLEHVGLLDNPLPGAEDDAFAQAGHGLTDVVKRPTRSAAELTEDEFREGVELLKTKIREWKPGLVLFAFKEAAVRALDRPVVPGQGPTLEGFPTFLLSGPYAAKAETERIDAELMRLLRRASPAREASEARSQKVTASDLARGQIRLPSRSEAKRLLPGAKGQIEIVLRSARVKASYDPRLGPDRERSGVLRVGPDVLAASVEKDEVLKISRGLGGVVRLD